MTFSKYSIYILVLISVSSCSRKATWVSIFDGKSLDNFEILNGTAEYYIDGDCIVGVSAINTPNTFLATRKMYSDFILEFEVLVDPGLNSGVQFRSISETAINDGRVHGYQCEIESSDRHWAGGIYDEARRGWLYPLKDNKAGREAFKVGEWNHYRIEAIGPELRTWVNGVACSNLKDNMTDSGLIGLQVHSIGQEDDLVGKEVRWKNLQVITKRPKKYRKEIEANAILIDLTDSNL